MKRMMLIGRTGSGKTTLCQTINNYDMKYKKTQTVEVIDNTIDTPGEYIENKFYYKALIVTSADSDVIALVQDCTEEESIFPPGFGSIFAKPVIGIITKVDSCIKEEDIKRAENILKAAGSEKIFKVSSLNNIGVDEIREYLYS